MRFYNEEYRMKTCQRTGYLQQRVAVLLFVLVSALVTANSAFALINGNQINACYDCHGTNSSDIRPIDVNVSPLRDSSSGGFQGNHQTHMPPLTTDINVCTKCHGLAVKNYSTSHRSTVINMRQHINSTVTLRRASYARQGGVTFFNQTSVPQLGGCSSVNCHFQRTTPTWGLTPTWNAGTPADCNNCHGTPPAGIFNATPLLSYTGGAAGSHAKHDLYYTGTTNCQKCHSNNTTFAHATSGRSGHSLNVSVKDPGNTQDGSYSRATTYPSYLPSQAPAAFGNCTNSYCHSQGNSPYIAPAAAVGVPPVWGTANVTCVSCHKGSGGTGMDSGTYGHLKHVQTYGYTCQRCHDATVTGNSTIKSYADHVDKLVTVKFYQNRSTALSGATYNGAAAYSAKVTHAPTAQNTPPTTASCTAVYCHSRGLSATDFSSAAFKPLSTPYWGKALSGGCRSCHGGNASNGFKTISSGSHRRHVAADANRYAFGCVQCHNQTVSSDIAISNPANHANFGINVNLAAGTYNGGAAKLPGSAYASCASVTCHGDGKGGFATQVWGAGTLSCTACHGNGAGVFPSGTTDLSTPHTNHVNNPTIGNIGVQLGCVDCHAKTVSTNTSVSNTANHSNAIKDYSGVRAGKSTTYTTVGGCTATYCHSSGKKNQFSGVTGYTEPVTAPLWNGTALTCNGCHGGPSSLAGEPVYTGGAAASASANTHGSHVLSASRIVCNTCHNTTVDTSGNLTAVGNHLNQAINVASAKFNYNAGARSCGTFTGGCHGSGTPTWGGAALTCISCHDITTSPAHMRHSGLYYTTRLSTGSPKYLNMTANVSTGADTDGATFKQYGFGCSVCHPLSSATHADGTVHISLNDEVGGGTMKSKTPSGATYTGTFSLTGSNVRCANVYCHSNGKNGFGNTSTWRYAYKPADRCTMCHGNAPSTGAHAQHAVGIHYDDISRLSFGKFSAAGITTKSAGHGDPLQSTTISCNTCHYGTTTFARNKYNSACSTSTCHGNNNGSNTDALGAARITALNKHVNGTVEFLFYTSALRTKAQVRTASFPSYTAAGWTRSTYKVGVTSTDTSKKKLNSATYSGGNCSNVACHNGNTINWTTTVPANQKCVNCHDRL
jgi:predicted CxxxxCH...CXXCH cytochrome family protein